MSGVQLHPNSTLGFFFSISHSQCSSSSSFSPRPLSTPGALLKSSSFSITELKAAWIPSQEELNSGTNNPMISVQLIPVKGAVSRYFLLFFPVSFFHEL